MPPTSNSQTADHDYGGDDGSLSFPLSHGSSLLEATPQDVLVVVIERRVIPIVASRVHEGFDASIHISRVFGGPPITQDWIIEATRSRGWANPTGESLQWLKRHCVPKMGVWNWQRLRLFKRESFTGSNFHLVFQGFSMSIKFTLCLGEP